MYEGAKNALSKVPEVTLGFWIIKILAALIGETGRDAVTMSLFLSCWDNDAMMSVSDRGLPLHGPVHRGRGDPDHNEAVSSLYLLGDNRGYDHRRNCNGRFRGPFLGYRLSRRIIASICALDDVASPLAVVGRHSFCKLDRNAAGGVFDPVHDPLLADVGHRARRLDGPTRIASATETLLSCLAQPCYSLLRSIASRTRRASFCSVRVADLYLTARGDARRPVRQADLSRRVRG